MDTEKHLEVQKKIEQGKSLSDEGPYYHHSWWEAYKGASKGELGGTVIGGALGALVGVVIASAAAIGGVVAGPAAIAGIVLGFSAGGIVYGVHKFSNVGAVTGAVAAAQHQAELRMDSMLDGIRQEIGEIKNAVKSAGSKTDKAATPPAPALSEKEAHLDHYRTTHYAKLEPPTRNRYVFWKIALMGLVVGAAAGAILAATGATASILEEIGLLGEHGALKGMGIGGQYLASVIPVAALGASLGINRDVFRKIFDKTDLWFKGVFDHSKLESHQLTSAVAVTREMEEKSHKKPAEKPAAAVATTVAIDGYIDYPKSSTYHRDRVLAAAEKALLSFDHTRATPQ